MDCGVVNISLVPAARYFHRCWWAYNVAFRGGIGGQHGNRDII